MLIAINCLKITSKQTLEFRFKLEKKNSTDEQLELLKV